MNDKEFIFDDDKNIEQNLNIQKKKKMYISFNVRLILTSIFTIIFIFCSIFLISNSLSVVKIKSINYKETSSVDYRVYLKENDFFTEKYLDKNNNITYIASLIKDIKINFNYLFTIDQPSSMDIVYDVIGKLVITSQKDGSKFFEKDYTLVSTVTDSIIDSNSYSINKDVVIDYDYYNNLANKFKYNYGVDSESYLNVYLTIKGENINENSFDINNNSVISLKIPLSEKAINIKLDYKDINEQKKIFSNQKSRIKNRTLFIIGIVLGIVSLLLIFKLIKLLTFIVRRKSKYDKYINKILREYDRLIINTRTAPKFEDFNVIRVDSFQELLDARDNVKGAIKYYIVTEHQKCNFYLTHGNDLYLLVIKEVDINNL